MQGSLTSRPLSPTFPLGDALDVFVRREHAERFIEEVRGDDPELASYLRIEERELAAGGLNYREPRCDRLRRLVRGICTAP